MKNDEDEFCPKRLRLTARGDNEKEFRTRAFVDELVLACVRQSLRGLHKGATSYQLAQQASRTEISVREWLSKSYTTKYAKKKD